MTTDNRRKEEQSEAKARDLEESSTPLLHGAMVDKAERKTSFLPSDEHDAYIATIESVESGRTMMEAYKAVKRNKGAPGSGGITTEEIKKVIQEQWPQIRQDIKQCYRSKDTHN